MRRSASEEGCSAADILNPSLLLLYNQSLLKCLLPNDSLNEYKLVVEWSDAPSITVSCRLQAALGITSADLRRESVSLMGGQ